MNIQLFACAQEYSSKVAIVSNEGTFTYQDLLNASSGFAKFLLLGEDDLKEQRIAFLIPPSFEYVAVQWGIWRAGGIAVPLCTVHPRPELEYVISNSGASIVIANPIFEKLLRPISETLNIKFILTSATLSGQASSLPAVDIGRRALILYTSGTTGKPKGVVITHGNIQAQVSSLIAAWEWSSNDRILHVLPLHHIHGIINVLTCALGAGAECHLIEKFNADIVWSRICNGDLTLFMAVPTIYVKLIAAWKSASQDRQIAMSQGCAKMRLMVSGSAALPIQVLNQWKDLSAHVLLERYGMTEIGMALSNPLRGERKHGSVGFPLPQVEVRLVDESGQVVPPGMPGEIQVKSPGVFLEYWQNPEETGKAFCEGWFCTGDYAVVEDSSYRILGRISVDIIKTGGYKVSALEIEEVLRTHPNIRDCTVVGVEDPEWGERVCAALVLRGSQTLTVESFRIWAKTQLAVYKIPTQIIIVEELPRNAIGKVTKPTVIQYFRS
ncbi:acyl-CoA synthetase [Altericista sp. CCNU0014]|uniref:acyl-CoA synthetase n=1 Tax=Altericista sp. CCNU0014 TaxID=3082949 RepID=UPI00384CE1B9